jgi:ubiquinone/menaquinone biosynthesis C-methylase UbiE
MIARAREFNADLPNCAFVVNNAPNLRLFLAEQFDLIYSSITLQHLPTPTMIESYLAEFARTLKPGGLLAFQLLAHTPPIYRFQPRRKLYAFLRRLGLAETTVYRRLQLMPIRITAMPEARVVSFLHGVGLHVLRVERSGHSRVYFATK